MCGAYEAIAAALQPSESSIGWIVAPTYDLSDRIFRTVHMAVVQHLKHRIVAMHERERWFVIRNLAGGTSELRCKSADNPVSLLGEGLDYVIVDEASRLPADIWDGHLAQRLVDTGGWALLLSTPRGMGWFYKAYRRGQKRRDPMYESWRSPSLANPHLSVEAIESERKRLSADAFAQEFEAAFIGADEDPCEVCGYPSLDACRVHIVRGGAEIPRCPECDQCVSAEGKTLVRKVPGFRNVLNIVRLFPDVLPPPTLPAEIQAMEDAVA